MKATKEQIIAEANRRHSEQGEGAPPVEHFIVDVVCENWTPPEPVDPDILAFREWRRTVGAALEGHPGMGIAYLAGARWAREQERERARKRKALRELTQLTEEFGGYEELKERTQ